MSTNATQTTACRCNPCSPPAESREERPEPRAKAGPCCCGTECPCGPSCECPPACGC